MKQNDMVDILVIGGGVNGAGIARDLSGRGLSVVLVEKDDLASATSSASTKLIHGGLRYLEHYAFRLVRESLIEREVLLRSAPHIIRPMTFVLPHHPQLRPWWMIRLGLYLYDFLGPRKILRRSHGRFLPGTALGVPLKSQFKRGFTYSDCWVEDSRLGVLNAVAAAEKGARILTRTECTGLARGPEGQGWLATLHDHVSDTHYKLRAQMVVNAAGPWVQKVIGLADESITAYKTRLVKGSHIVVPRLYKGDHAYILQNQDGRIVFVIPYEGKYSLIGTTDVDFDGDASEARATIDEVEYLCAAVSTFFRQQITPDHVEWTYSGVRPLLDDGDGKAQSVTRDYKLELTEFRGAPLLNVFGGKLTTFRKLAEHAGDLIVEKLGRGTAAWTKTAPLPGGEGAAAHFDTFYKTFRREFNWLPEGLSLRYARAYGARARDMMRGFKRMADLGEHLGDDVYEVEIAYLVRHEWALTVDDIIWRRSKLGLHIGSETQHNIKRMLRIYLEQSTA